MPVNFPFSQFHRKPLQRDYYSKWDMWYRSINIIGVNRNNNPLLYDRLNEQAKPLMQWQAAGCVQDGPYWHSLFALCQEVCEHMLSESGIPEQDLEEIVPESMTYMLRILCKTKLTNKSRKYANNYFYRQAYAAISKCYALKYDTMSHIEHISLDELEHEECILIPKLRTVREAVEYSIPRRRQQAYYEWFGQYDTPNRFVQGLTSKRMLEVPIVRIVDLLEFMTAFLEETYETNT
jgi:hypothetical protein